MEFLFLEKEPEEEVESTLKSLTGKAAGPDSVGGGWVVRRCWVNFLCRGVLPLWIIVGQGPIVLAIGASGGCLDIFFSRPTLLFSFSLSLGEGPI